MFCLHPMMPTSKDIVLVAKYRGVIFVTSRGASRGPRGQEKGGHESRGTERSHYIFTNLCKCTFIFVHKQTCGTNLTRNHNYLAIFHQQREYLLARLKSIQPKYKHISKYIQDISKIHKMITKYQAAAGPAQVQGRAGPGRGPGLGPGRLPLGILYLSYISWIS